MLRSLRKSLTTMIAGLALAVVPAIAIPAVAAAQNIQEGLKCGSALKADQTEGCESDTKSGADSVNKMVTDIINFISVFVGIVSVVMIIWGGFKYVTSGGDSGNVTGAKNTIIYAVIGLVVVALAQFIVQFVLEKVTGSE